MFLRYRHQRTFPSFDSSYNRETYLISDALRLLYLLFQVALHLKTEKPLECTSTFRKCILSGSISQVPSFCAYPLQQGRPKPIIDYLRKVQNHIFRISSKNTPLIYLFTPPICIFYWDEKLERKKVYGTRQFSETSSGRRFTYLKAKQKTHNES